MIAERKIANLVNVLYWIKKLEPGSFVCQKNTAESEDGNIQKFVEEKIYCLGQKSKALFFL